MIAQPPQLDSQSTRTPASGVPLLRRILAIILRALFLTAVMVIIARVSAPQSETIWTVHETPADLARLAVGVAACVWIAIHVFLLPKDDNGYTIWLYLGPLIVPLGWLIALAKW
jgi:hypothetical protein